MIGEFITISGVDHLDGRWEIIGGDNELRYEGDDKQGRRTYLELRPAPLHVTVIDMSEARRRSEEIYREPPTIEAYHPVRLDELRNAVRALCVEFPDQSAQAMRDRKMRGFFIGKLMDRYGDKVHHATYVEIVHAEFRRAAKKEEAR